MTGRVGPRVALAGAIIALVTGVVGLVVSLLLNVFVFDDFDAYGEVPIPGSARLHLPAGEATISFHTAVPGGVSGGFPVPALQLGITPPGGSPEPVVTESVGATTSVNSDVRIRLWTAQIAEDGVYDVAVRGDVAGYINPQLAFGRDDSPWWLVWAFGGLVAAGVASLVLAILWRLRSPRAVRDMAAPVNLDELTWPGPVPPPVHGYEPTGPGQVPPPVHSYEPTDTDVRLEQLKTLAALRESGALTDAEFEAEKRRILGS